MSDCVVIMAEGSTFLNHIAQLKLQNFQLLREPLAKFEGISFVVTQKAGDCAMNCGKRVTDQNTLNHIALFSPKYRSRYHIPY